MKRFLSLVLCVCLMFALLPLNLVIAEGEAAAGLTDEEIAELFEGEGAEFIQHPGVETDSDTFFYEEGELDDIDDLLDGFRGLGDEHGIYEPDDIMEDETDEIEIIEDDEYEVEILIDFSEENLEQLSHEYVMDEIIIKFIDESEVPERELRRYHRERARFEKVNYVEGLDVYVIRVSEMRRDPNAVLNRYKNNKYIEYAEPNYIAKAESVPNDTHYAAQQAAAMNRINAPAGWSILSGNPNAPIAIIDGGIIANHQDLPRLVSNFSAVSSVSPNNDSTRHGTHVAGVAASIGNNGVGVAGINWNASLMNVKVNDANGVYNLANVARGITWATDNGARIINLSLAWAADSTTLKNAIDYAYNRGVVIVAASGNSSLDNVFFPARYSNVLGVGATTNGTSRVSWSNHGTGVDVVANGIMATTSSTSVTTYGNATGTSFATPQVAGLASLVLGINPNLRNHEVYNLIRQGARPLGGGFNTQTGHGIIDIARTLELARATLPQAQVAPTTVAPTTIPPTTAAPTTVPPTTAAPTTAAPTTIPPAAPPMANLPETASSFVTSVPSGTRNNFTASLGYEFEPLSDMTVSFVGRPLNGTMNFAHKIYIWEVSTQTLLATAEVRPDSPLENGFKIAQLDRTITLRAGQRYRIVSAETAGGDRWFNIDQSRELTLSANASLIMPVHTLENETESFPVTIRTPRENKGFVGVTFFYELVNAEAVPTTAAPAAPLPPTEPTPAIPPVITLLGTGEVKINVGEAYVEPGYKAVDSGGNNIADRVVVTHTINSMQAGLYTITYEVTDGNGNVARETRLVFVEELPRIPPTAPIITLVGSNPIILHETSSTPYTEQGAIAIDFDGTEIPKAQITESWDRTFNRNVPGSYFVTYTATGSTGLSSSITREVRILAPVETIIRRVEYGFSGKGKQGDTVRHTNVVAKAAGFIDLGITALGSGTTVTVAVIDSANRTVVSDRFSALGTRQYQIAAGTYEVRVTFTQASGNKDYRLNVIMPAAPDDVKTFFLEEVPLSEWGEGSVFERDPDMPRGDLPSWYSTVSDNVTAIPSMQTITVNGESITLNAYLIEEVPFFRLRDFAYMLKGSANEFNVEWHEEDNAIVLTSGESYIAVGGEMESIGGGNKTPQFTESGIFLDGTEIRVAAYLIEGNNYFMYSELARIFGLNIEWIPQAQTITVVYNAVIPFFQIEKLCRRMREFIPKNI